MHVDFLVTIKYGNNWLSFPEGGINFQNFGNTGVN